MPEPIEEYYARVEAAADADGRLASNAEIQAWEVFPFESDGLRLKPLAPLATAEAPRHGEGGSPCGACDRGDGRVDGEAWRDDHWHLSVADSSGAPLLVILSPHAHHDVTTLPMDRAAEMGQIMVALGAAIEALPSVARGPAAA